MKLHLPSRLRAAVLACLTMVSSLVPTLATGALSGGVVVYALAGSTAWADGWNAGTNTYTGNSRNMSVPNPVPETITFQITSGYFQSGLTYTSDIVIDGGSNAATTGLVINNGNRATYVEFSGNVTGNGALKKTGPGTNLTFRFTGNVTGYTGAVTLGASAAFTLQFGNGAAAPTTTEAAGASGTGDITFTTANNTLLYNYAAGETPTYVTNAIIKNGGTSKVTLSGASKMYFTKDVAIDTLTVNENAVNTAALTFTGGTISTVAGAVKSLVKDKSGSLTVNNITCGGVEVRGGSLTLGGSSSIRLTQSISNAGTLTFGSDVRIDITGLTSELGDDGRYYYTLVDGGTTNLDTLSIDNITGYVSTGKADWQFNADGTISYQKTNHDLFYDGGTLVWNTTDASFAGGATFAQNDEVTFRTGTSDVTLEEDIEVAVLTVQSGARVNLNLSDHTLTASSVNVEFSGVLQLNNIAHFTGKVTGEGALALNTGSILSLGTGAGQVGAIVNYTAGTANIDELRIMSGTTVEMTSSTAQPGVWNSFDRIVVEAGGMLSDRVIGYTIGSASQTIVIAGAGSETTGVDSTNVRAALAFGLGTRDNLTLALDSKVELSDDATIYCGHNATTVRTAGMAGTLDLQGHTMTKTGTGVIVLRDDVTGSGAIVVQEGTLSFGANATSANTLDDTGITVESGAFLNIYHAAMESTAAVTLSGGTLDLVTSGANEATIALGQLTVNGETASTITGTTGSLSFSQVTGSGDVTVTSAAATESTTPGGEVYMEYIHNYSGTMTVNAVEGSGRTTRVGTIDQAEGVSGTITGEVDSRDFQKVGAGGITLGTLNASGKLYMNYEGTLSIGSVAVAEGTTLAYGVLPYGGGDVDLGKVIEIGSLEHSVTLDVSAIDWDTLLRGIDLGLVSGVDSGLLQGVDDYELYDENGHLWLKANPNDLVWDNGTGIWNDTNVNWDKDGTDVAYTSKSNVIFIGDSPATVTIEGEQAAMKMTVERGDFTFTKGETDALTLLGALTIGNGADVAAAHFRFDLAASAAVVKQHGTLEVEGMLTLDSLENNGQVSAAGAVVLGALTGTGSLTVGDGSWIGSLDGAGSLTTTGEVQVGTVTEPLSTLTILEDSTLTLGSGATVGTLDNSGTLEVKGALTLTEASDLGGNVTAEEIALQADVAFAKLEAKTVNMNDHTLTVGDGSRIGALEGAGSLVAEGGTVHISSKAMSSIRTTGADIVLNNLSKGGTPTLVLAEPGSMEGGSLTFSVAVDDMLSDTGTPRIFAGNLALSDTTLTLNVAGIDEKTTYLNISPGDGIRNVKLAQLAEAVSADARSRFVQLQGGALLEKYYTNARLQDDGAIVADRVTDYYSSRISYTPNGHAGASLLDDLLLHVNPQAASTDMPDLAAAMDAVDALIKAGNGAEADRTAAAMAGSTAAVLGLALSGDVERQLKAIRNRTTGMGVNERLVHEDMPYVNAWINGEGNYHELEAGGTDTGYKLNSWGGTVGVDLDASPNLTFGLALTAMYGDLEADGADTAEGDFDTCYVTAFARYAGSSWTHTFVATVGLADMTLDRTVNYGSGSYKTTGDTDGVAFGLLYELGYVVPLNENATACLQPVFNVAYRHSGISGYSENGSDAGLNVEDQSMDTVTFGLGARLQTVFGETVYNRASLFELRALLKVDAGDRQGESDVCFLSGDRRAAVQSEEVGAVGLEAGVGITVPVGADDGSLFADTSLDIRNGYTGFNGTVGYRINF